MGTEFGERLLANLNEFLRRDLPCSYAGCPEPAGWIATFRPCGHLWAYCEEHKDDLSQWMASPRERVQCVDENNTIVSAIEWERKKS